jgi:hypothetical protein
LYLPQVQLSSPWTEQYTEDLSTHTRADQLC